MKGMVHLYTGDGKGKTTSSLGLICRALGHKKKVCYISFFKEPEKWSYGEIKTLKKLKVKTYFCVKKHPHWYKECKKEKIQSECKKMLEFIKDKIYLSGYDIIVLDEILVAVRDKYVNIVDIIEIIKSKPKNVELILTGRGNKDIIDKLYKYCDYLSVIQKYKHPFDLGIKSRKGIEF